MNFEILVNKNNLLSKDYKPKLYIVDDNKNNFHNYIDPNLKPELALEIKSYVDKLLNDAWKSGMFIIVDSGYRSYEYQKVLYNGYLKYDPVNIVDTFSARPGHSEHQTGLAIDLSPIDDSFAYTKEYSWLKDNAHKYGFILRYPNNFVDLTGYKYEPWHYRYVGVDVATYIYNNNITFDEYYEFYLKH